MFELTNFSSTTMFFVILFFIISVFIFILPSLIIKNEISKLHYPKIIEISNFTTDYYVLENNVIIEKNKIVNNVCKYEHGCYEAIYHKDVLKGFIFYLNK